jgi:ATP-dependent RNA helicase RhlE
MAGAQTGTGKTAGFTLPMLQRLSSEPRREGRRGRTCIRALILTPTRELAAQVEESVRTYGKYLPLTSMVMFGGVGMGRRSTSCAAAWTSWWPRPGACSTTTSRARWT